MKNEELAEALAQLTLRVDALEAAAGLVKPAAIPARAPVLEEGTRIFYPVDPNAFMMPGSNDLKKLLAIVYGKYPQLKPDFSRAPSSQQAEAEHFTGFSNAFLRIGNLYRTEELNKKVSVSWWHDECVTWLEQRNIYSATRGAGFLAAVLAHGDIDYQLADLAQGVPWEFALSPYQGRRATGEGWRRVLATGQIRSSIQHAGSAAYPTRGVRIGYATGG